MRCSKSWRENKIFSVSSVNVCSETVDVAHPSDSIEPAVSGEPLRPRIVSALKWQIAGQFGTQGFRLATNLVLTRLLVPEAFGLMGMVQVFIISLQMISDVGLLGSVVHHPRGDSPRFLNTAWTVQVVRGLLLWVIICLGAYPFALVYEMPELVWLLPLTGLDAVFRSFASTSLLTCRRDIQPQRFILVTFGSQVAGAIVMIILAAITHSVLALAVGWVVSSIAYAWLSFLGTGVLRNRFEWDAEAGRSILQFGRWTAGSSTLTIMQLQGDRMVLGKLFSTGQLGIYTIGANLALPPLSLFQQICGQIALPTYAKVRDLPVAVARSKIRRLRLGVVLSLWSILALVVVLAQPLVDLCYPPEFREAGWYCSLVALGVMFQVSTDLGPIFLARGNARMHFLIMLQRTVMMVLAITVGFLVGRSMGQAVHGVIYGIVFTPLLCYPVQAACYHRVNAWLPEVDLPGIAATLALFTARWMGVC